MDNEYLVRPLVCLRVFQDHPTMHGLRQDGIGVVVVG